MYPKNVKTIEDLREWSDGIKPDFSLTWGRLTNDGYVTRKLIDCDTDHLENILVTQAQLTPVYKRTIIEILTRRAKNELPKVGLKVIEDLKIEE